MRPTTSLCIHGCFARVGFQSTIDSVAGADLLQRKVGAVSRSCRALLEQRGCTGATAGATPLVGPSEGHGEPRREETQRARHSDVRLDGGLQRRKERAYRGCSRDVCSVDAESLRGDERGRGESGRANGCDASRRIEQKNKSGGGESFNGGINSRAPSGNQRIADGNKGIWVIDN